MATSCNRKAQGGGGVAGSKHVLDHRCKAYPHHILRRLMLALQQASSSDAAGDGITVHAQECRVYENKSAQRGDL